MVHLATSRCALKFLECPRWGLQGLERCFSMPHHCSHFACQAVEAAGGAVPAAGSKAVVGNREDDKEVQSGGCMEQG